MSAQFPPLATAVARLATDAATARRISDAVTETFDCEEVAASAFEQANGRWSLTLDFRDSPDEAAVRALVAAAAGATAAQALVFETLAPTDWVRKSQEGLTPVGAGRFVVHAAHHRGRGHPQHQLSTGAPRSTFHDVLVERRAGGRESPGAGVHDSTRAGVFSGGLMSPGSPGSPISFAVRAFSVGSRTSHTTPTSPSSRMT